MAIVREFRCAAHGPFESTRPHPKCPKGCSKRFVVQELRTAPGVVGMGTKHLDREFDNLARDYRLTDIRNGKDGESVMSTLRKNPSFAPSWGNVQHAKPGFSQRGEASPTFSPASYGAQPANLVAELQPTFTGPKPIITHAPYREPLPK